MNFLPNGNRLIICAEWIKAMGLDPKKLYLILKKIIGAILHYS